MERQAETKEVNDAWSEAIKLHDVITLTTQVVLTFWDV